MVLGSLVLVEVHLKVVSELLSWLLYCLVLLIVFWGFLSQLTKEFLLIRLRFFLFLHLFLFSILVFFLLIFFESVTLLIFLLGTFFFFYSFLLLLYLFFFNFLFLEFDFLFQLNFFEMLIFQSELCCFIVFLEIVLEKL